MSSCVSLPNLDASIFILQQIIKNNYSGTLGVQSANIALKTDAGTTIVPNVKLVSIYNPPFNNQSGNAYGWEVELSGVGDCGWYNSCKITQIVIYGSWGSLEYNDVVDVSSCNITIQNNTQFKFRYGKVLQPPPNVVEDMLGDWFIEFWAEVFNILAGANLPTAQWNSGQAITGLGYSLINPANGTVASYNFNGVTQNSTQPVLNTIKDGIQMTAVINLNSTQVISAVEAYVQFNISPNTSNLTFAMANSGKIGLVAINVNRSISPGLWEVDINNTVTF